MIASLLKPLEALFGWLLEASWQASILAILVLLLQAVLRGRLNPRWNYALWLLVLLRLLLPVLPESALSLFQFTPQPSPALIAPVTEPLFTPALPSPIGPMAIAPATEPRNPFSLYSLLALAWLAGALVLLVFTWEVNRRFARQVRNSPQITDSELLGLFAAAQAELGVRRSIRLIENSHIQSPAIMGLFHPTLLLPANVRARFSNTELRFIFLHELAHLKRGDVIVQGLIALLQILHWFNPVLWYAFRRMRIDREPATDALVLSRAGEAEKERYGLMLIKLLEDFNQRHSLPTLVGILEDKDQFKRRFSLIARFTRGAYGWSLLGALLIVVLSALCLTAKESNASPLSSKPRPTTLPPIYVRFDKNVRYDLNASFFGPIDQQNQCSDLSLIPGTDQVISVICRSFTPTEAELIFTRSWPAGKLPPPPTGNTFEIKQVPLRKVFSFRIFGSVDVTTSPTNPNPPANDINTPLLGAIYDRDYGKARSLVNRGEHIIITDMEAALEIGPPKVAKLLWDAGARYVSEMTYTISQGASVSDLEKLLAKGTPVERLYDLTITPLGMAARTGNVEAARWLLDHGANIHATRSPLDLAVKGESVEMVDFLLKNGAQIDQFTLAITMGFGDFSEPGLTEKRMEMVKLLIKAGAFQHMDEAAKVGLLVQACERKNPALLKLYLDAGLRPLSKKALEIARKSYSQRNVDPARQGMQPLIDILETASQSPTPKADADTSTTQALPKGDMAETPGNIPPGYVRIKLQVMQIGEDDYQAHRGDIDAAVKGGYPASLYRLKSFDLLWAPMADSQFGKLIVLAPGDIQKQNLIGQFDFTAAPAGNNISIKGRLTLNNIQGSTQKSEKIVWPNIVSHQGYVSVELGSGQTIGLQTPEVSGVNDTPEVLSGPYMIPSQDGKANTLARLFFFLTTWSGPPVATASNIPPAPAATANPALDKALIDVARDGRTDKVGKGDADKVAQLLAQGADPNAKDASGTTALIWALNFGKDAVAVLLLQHGADGGAKDANGENAAWSAARIYYCPGALDLMIQKGVDVTAPNKQGRTIFTAMTSAVPAQPGKMNYLRDRVWTPAEYQAYEERERRTVDLLVAAGVDFNGREGTETPLMSAIHIGHYEMARALIEHGAKLDLKDQNGGTALAYIFLWAGFRPFPVDLLETLLKHGCDPNAPLFSFQSPTPISPLEAVMYVAPAKNPNGAAATPNDPALLAKAVQVLLDHGANPSFKDAQGNTPISLARKLHPELVPLLQAHAVDLNPLVKQGSLKK